MGRASRQTVSNALVTLVTIGIVLVAAEVAVRWFVPMEKATLIHDPVLGLRGRPNVETIWTREMGDRPRVVRTNDEGFHDVPRDKRKAVGTHRIVFIGDSFLEAYQLPVEQNFCQLLERNLASQFRWTVECINTGVHTYGLGSYYLFSQHRLRDWSPDAVVVVLFLGNDLYDNFSGTASAALPSFSVSQGQLVQHAAPAAGPWVWARDHLLARSALSRLTWLSVIKSNDLASAAARKTGLIGSPQQTTSDIQLNQAIEVAKLLMTAIRHAVPEESPLLFYVIPDPVRVSRLADRATESWPLAERRAERIEAAMVEFLSREGFDFVYPVDEFVSGTARGEELFLNGAGHLSASGHALSARMLLPRIIETNRRRTGVP